MTIRPLLKTIPDEERAALVTAFLEQFDANHDRLVELAVQSVKTPIRYHLADHTYTRTMIGTMLQGLAAPADCMFRPCGTVVLGLSGNEPLISGVVPMLAAILPGNIVKVRPSSVTRAFVEEIVALLRAAGMPSGILELLPPQRDVLADVIAASDHVVWFGSSDVCAQIAHQASASWTTFVGDAEGFDVAIFDDTLAETAVRRYARLVIQSVAHHDGQSCQAVRAVLAHRDVAKTVYQALCEAAEQLHVGPFAEMATQCTAPPEINYVDDFVFPERAPFAAVLQVAPYHSEPALQRLLEENPYGLSVSVFSTRDWQQLQRGPLLAARVARIVINADPHHVEPTSPWGGYRRSGSYGPDYWLTKFVDRVVITRPDGSETA